MGTISPIASCRLLGPFTLSRDGVEVVLPRKAQALLTLLALHEGAPLAREIVADMLWTASGPEQARLSLRQCLWSIGRAAGCDLVWAERQLLRLAENVAVDARDFQSLAASQARPDMSQCADLYRGELLAALAPVSPRFDEWLTVERQRLRGLAAGVLRRLAEAQVAAGEFDAAVAAARHLVALDDLNEDAQRLLMRILGQAGRRAEGLRQFQLCQQTLRRELNIEPDAETWILAQSLREGPRVGSTLLAPQQPVSAPSAPVQQAVERRQVTVMSCKLDGLTGLASEVEPEELGTQIAFFRDLCREYVSRFGGVISRIAGDGCLAVFGYPQAHEYNSESAVRAGLAIVEAARRIGGCDSRLHTRIGVATGSAVVGDLTGEGTGELYLVVGDNANLASRLGALANSDAVVIDTGTRRLLGDLFEYRDLGAIELRGLTEAVPVWQVLRPSAIPSRFEALHGSALSRPLGRDEEIDFLLRRWRRPVRVYRVEGPAAPIERRLPASLPPLPLPDKPSIAVLPFRNMSGDPEQEYFADGMVEEIITTLSRIRWLFVIARNSSFTYKGQAIDVKQVGHELGVRYVLEGAVRKAGNRVRITAQLIDATNGAHLWADHFDGVLEDVFDLQDKIASRVAGVIEPALQAAETARSVSRPTDDLTAYDLYLRGYALALASTRQCREALHLMEQAIARDPRYGLALAWAAFCCFRLLHDDRSDNPMADRGKGADFARRALEVAGDDPSIVADAARSLAYFGEDIGTMTALVDRALALNPNYARGWHISGALRLWAGRPDIAIEHIDTALRLSPRARVGTSLAVVGAAHFLSRRFEEAVPKLLLAVQEDPSHPVSCRYLIACYAHMGRLDEAREIVARLRAITPVVIPDASFLRNAVHRELFLSGLRLAAGEPS